MQHCYCLFVWGVLYASAVLSLDDATVVVCLVGAFVWWQEVPKPTVALEYTYGRRSNSTTSAKDIAHIWELGEATHVLCSWALAVHLPVTCSHVTLPCPCMPTSPGGGALLSDLINVPITPHRLPTAVVALTVDLAKVRRGLVVSLLPPAPVCVVSALSLHDPAVFAVFPCPPPPPPPPPTTPLRLSPRPQCPP